MFGYEFDIIFLLSIVGSFGLVALFHNILISIMSKVVKNNKRKSGKYKYVYLKGFGGVVKET